MGKTYKIAVMGGDGTGPEVAAEGVKVLKVAADKFNFNLELTDFDYGGDRYLQTGEVLPDNAAEELARHDAIFLGAIGHPDVKPGILESDVGIGFSPPKETIGPGLIFSHCLKKIQRAAPVHALHVFVL